MRNISTTKYFLKITVYIFIYSKAPKAHMTIAFSFQSTFTNEVHKKKRARLYNSFPWQRKSAQGSTKAVNSHYYKNKFGR